MGSQITPAFLMFPTSGPIFDRIGYFPNQPAANAGILPSLLGIAGGPGNIPLLNDFQPIMPSLVTQIFRNTSGQPGPEQLGPPLRPSPFGAFTPNGGGGQFSNQGTLPSPEAMGTQGQGTQGGQQVIPASMNGTLAGNGGQQVVPGATNGATGSAGAGGFSLSPTQIQNLQQLLTANPGLLG